MSQLQEKPDLLDAPSVAGDETTHIREVLAGRKFDYNTAPPPVEPRFFIGNIPVSTAGNLTTISAHIKSGKTATIGAAMASVMPTITRVDNLGWKSSNPAGLAVVHFDTEQSPEDHYAAGKRTIDRAGLVEAPPWFVSYCLRPASATCSGISA